MSLFGIRRRLKKILGTSTPSTSSTSNSSGPSHSVVSESNNLTPQKTSDSNANNLKETPSSKSVPNSSKTQASTQASTQSPTQSQSAEPSEKDAKILKHRRRTKKALLKLTVEQGGKASLGDLHELGERRYFIAHKAFSDLMEEMVAEGLFLYDWSSQEATITETGTQFLETQ